ncbi:MAG TPA: hypothetical protein VGP38_12295, partial [Rubrobacter sp.]|nr:hypothetical protein [Rubrobacter sp.]
MEDCGSIAPTVLHTYLHQQLYGLPPLSWTLDLGPRSGSRKESKCHEAFAIQSSSRQRQLPYIDLMPGP